MCDTSPLNFIEKFHGSSEEVFTEGCCYWFAFILFDRFRSEGARMMYDAVENHFGTMVCGRVFDITGDVTDKYNWIDWDEYDDITHKNRIIRDCVLI